MTYAKGTDVSVEKSRAEIESILDRYGATAFRYGRDQTRAVIEFAAKDRHIRFVLPLPDRTDARFTSRFDKRRRVSVAIDDPQVSYRLWEQACREKWRALCLCIKAKLEAVESGISEFEAEFLAHIVDPGTGRTVYELVTPQLRLNYEGHQGDLLLLPAPSEGE